MNWIDVDEDLPPADVQMLLVGELNRGYDTPLWIMSEGSFNPKTGWDTALDEVHYWACRIPLPVKKEKKVEVPSDD